MTHRRDLHEGAVEVSRVVGFGGPDKPPEPALFRSRRDQRRHSRVAAAVLVAGIIPALIGSPVGHASEGSLPLEYVAEFPVSSKSTARAYVSWRPEHRTVFHLDSVLGGSAAGGIHKGGNVVINNNEGVRFLDADTFERLGDDLDLQQAAGTAGMSIPSIRAAAVDQDRNVLYVGASVEVGVDALGGGSPWIAVVDGTTRELARFVKVNDLRSFRFDGISYDAESGTIYGVMSIPNVPATTTFVALDARALVEDGTVEVKGTFALPECENLPRGEVMGTDGAFLYVVCTGFDSPGTKKPEVMQGVFRLTLGNDGRLPLQSTPPEFLSVPGSYLFGGAVFDPGSGRLAMASRPFGPSAAIVVDGRSMSIVGSIGQSGDFTGACANELTGRFYSFSDGTTGQDGGLVLGEMRVTPSPQGLGFPDLVLSGARKPTGLVACDPLGRRVYHFSQHNSGQYNVLQDNIPPVAAELAGDPDRNTTQGIADDPAVSRATYQASGRAYGARLTWVGGYSALAFNFQNIGALTSLYNSPPPACPPGQPCGSLGSSFHPSGRVLTLGAIGFPGDARSVSLSNFRASAVAGGAVRDGGSARDMTANGSHADEWPFDQHSCAVSPGEVPSPEDRAEWSGRGARVSCDADEGQVSASAVSTDGFEIPGVVRVSGASSDVSSRLDAERGIVTTSVARVRAVELGDRIVLHGIEAVAETSARGAQGTAKATYSRSFGKVAVDDNVICESCSPAQVVDIVNAVQPFDNLTVTLPTAREVQTPGGYQASVRRDFWEHTHDQTMNESSSFDAQVPALRLMLLEDAYQHSAFIVDLAAPQAEATRGLRPCFFCADLPAPPSTPPGPTPTAPTATSGVGAPAALPTTGANAPVIPARFASFAAPASNPRADAGDGGDGRSFIQDIQRGLGQLAEGLKMLFSSPGNALKALLVFSVMAAPVYLAARRQLIVRRLAR